MELLGCDRIAAGAIELWVLLVRAGDRLLWLLLVQGGDRLLWLLVGLRGQRTAGFARMRGSCWCWQAIDVKTTTLGNITNCSLFHALRDGCCWCDRWAGLVRDLLRLLLLVGVCGDRFTPTVAQLRDAIALWSDFVRAPLRGLSEIGYGCWESVSVAIAVAGAGGVGGAGVVGRVGGDR
ncbi:MAG: hypothetical protein QNJ54_22235 [Prochloraceae cyanobacterium]|nr:hypothetical protein [Prochloraceae cyanobacterium]